MHAPTSPQQIPRMCKIVLGNKAFSDSDSDSDFSSGKLFNLNTLLLNSVPQQRTQKSTTFKPHSGHIDNI